MKRRAIFLVLLISQLPFLYVKADITCPYNTLKDLVYSCYCGSDYVIVAKVIGINGNSKRYVILPSGTRNHNEYNYMFFLRKDKKSSKIARGEIFVFCDPVIQMVIDSARIYCGLAEKKGCSQEEESEFVKELKKKLKSPK